MNEIHFLEASTLINRDDKKIYRATQKLLARVATSQGSQGSQGIEGFVRESLWPDRALLRFTVPRSVFPTLLPSCSVN